MVLYILFAATVRQVFQPIELFALFNGSVLKNRPGYQPHKYVGLMLFSIGLKLLTNRVWLLSVYRNIW